MTCSFRIGICVLAVLPILSCGDNVNTRERSKRDDNAEMRPNRSEQPPSVRRAWPIQGCDSMSQVERGRRMCVQAAAQWDHLGAVLCGGKLRVDTGGLPNVFAPELIEHCQRQLNVRCPDCRVTNLFDGGKGKLDMCVEVARVGAGEVVGSLTQNDDVEVTQIEEQVYFYSGPGDRDVGRRGVLSNVKLRARYTHPSE
jgi:hypothetical protein